MERCGRYLREDKDLAADIVPSYLSDLRQFTAFCEASWAEGEEGGAVFAQGVTMPTITLYCSHLKNALELKPASSNRHLVSIKRYFAWAADEGLLQETRPGR